LIGRLERGALGATEVTDIHDFKRYRLQDRDKQLLAFMAMGRYLTTEQIRRLSFPGRTETPADKRLRQLAGIGKYGFPNPFVERRMYRNYEGQFFPVWKPTLRGYVAAANVLPGITQPPKGSEIPDQFLEHTLLLNEVLVGLAEAPAKIALAKRVEAIPRRRHRSSKDGLYANAKTLGFKWIPYDSVRLPWREQRDGNTQGRVIQPDAVIELPTLSRRVFLECETGSHTIVPTSPDKPGSTLSKVERYQRFICGRPFMDEGITFYGQQFPDRFAPEVLFVTPRQSRAASINKAVLARLKGSEGRWRWPTALTLQGAAREILNSLGQWGPELEPAAAESKPRGVFLEAREVRRLYGFCQESYWTLKKLRQKARDAGAQTPPYPTEIDEVLALADQLWTNVNGEGTR
jgi:protein involved in plasmid replication-relaxation